jgi:hypothetical protein
MYSALKLQKEYLASQLDNFSRISSISNISWNQNSSKHTVSKVKDPNSINFIDYAMEMASNISYKLPMESPKLTFNYRNWDIVQNSYQKINGRYVLSPTS